MTEEAAADWFYEDLQHILKQTHTKNVLFIMEVGGTIKNRNGKGLTEEDIKKR